MGEPTLQEQVKKNVDYGSEVIASDFGTEQTLGNGMNPSLVQMRKLDMAPELGMALNPNECDVTLRRHISECLSSREWPSQHLKLVPPHCGLMGLSIWAKKKLRGDMFRTKVLESGPSS